MKIKKVLLVTNIFPPIIGGPATFIDKMAWLLSKKGYKVTVICSSFLPAESSDRDRPFKVVRIPLQNRLLYELRLRFSLIWHLFFNDKVLVNGLENYVYPLAELIKRRYLIKVVGDTVWETARNQGTTSLNIDHFQTNRIAQIQMERPIIRRNKPISAAEKIIVPSEYLKTMVTRWGVPEKKIEVILNGVTIGNALPCVERNCNEPLRLLFVGRVTNWKGLETILFAMVKAPNCVLDVVGEGPALPLIISIASQLQLQKRIQFRGRLSAAETQNVMSKSHVLILMSLYEGLSHTMIEANSLGVPCIASNCGGNNEVIIDGTNGFLIRPEAPDELAFAINRFEQDEELRRRMSINAKKEAIKFSMSKTVEKYEELFL